MKLKVKNIDGKRIQIFLNEFDTCELLKLKIEKGFGVTPDNQKLIFNKTILEVNNIPLKNYGLCDDSTIDVFNYSRNVPMEIGMKTKYGKEVTLNVMKKDKIIEVKRYIQNKLDISPNQQMLIYKDQFLDDRQTLKSYNINEAEVITMVERFQHPIEITINTNFNLTLKFNLYPNEEVISLKREIFKKTKIKLNEQRLFYSGTLLKDEKTLDKYDIIEDSEIYLEVNSQTIIIKKMVIYHPLTDRERKKFKKLRIVELKRKIITRLGLSPEEQKLVYNGKILPEHKTTFECHINYNYSLKNIKAEMKISVNSKDNETIDVWVMKSEKIIDLKWIICDKMGIDPKRQELTYKGEVLKNENIIKDYNIEEADIVNIHTFKMQLFAQLNGGKLFTLNVNKFDPIFKAKQQMKELCGLPPEEQMFVYKYGFLKDERTLQNYLIADQSILNVISKLKTNIRVLLKKFDETEYLIDTIENEKVIDLKRKVENISGIDIQDQVLIHKGCLLEDEKTLNEYEITKYSVIDITEPQKKIHSDAL